MDGLTAFLQTEWGVLAIQAAMIPALWIILRRIGKQPAWSLLVMIPVIGLAVVLGIAATGRWPNQRPKPEV